MILNIRIQNYRSFKEEVEFSLVANGSASKEINVCSISICNGQDSVRVLKTSMIFGANASGKTNVLLYLFEIIRFIRSDLNVGESIDIYDPFKFSEATKNAPSSFEIDFLGKDSLKYTYRIAFTKTDIIKEQLTYYPESDIEKELFSRIVSDGKIHSIKSAPEVNKSFDIFSNQTILSKFGKNEPHKIISEVFLYLTSIEVINACDSRKVSRLKNDTSKYLVNNDIARKRMDQLISFADTGIKSMVVDEIDKSKIENLNNLPEEIKTVILNENKSFFSTYGVHDSYNIENEKIGSEALSLTEESHGTQILYSMGGVLLKALEEGSVIFVDELNTGLHPYLSKLLVTLFQSKRINKHNAQLIFTTHDTTLLNKNLFRTDQVWLVEKTNEGKSELYSLQDFEDVSEDTDFDKWYMAGKFGGIPLIKSIESLFMDHEKE